MSERFTEQQSAELEALEWFSMPDGLQGFRGKLNGVPRQIVGDSFEQLVDVAYDMLEGRR